ncbi:phage/plasmid primase, P4 family [Mycolicibacter algericus]|uniref:phage/plasmid primase, P4 family n=1 Tax=Mycolicibacter algericus TaxID=1288388 RepID=UPI001F355D34
MSWDTQRWEVAVDDGQVITAAHTVIESIDTTGDQATAKHKIKSLSKTGLEAMVALARRNPAMRITRDRLDADPYLLNTPSGVIDLRTATLTPHTPHGWHTKITGAAYDRDLPAPRWHQFLHTTFGGDDELIRYVQRLAGYAAIGEVTHHVLPFLFGAGQNGKSVLLDVLVDVLGDYALTAPANFLLAGQTKHETEIARLNGARLVVCSEVNQESRFDEAKIKSLTGGDKITGRFMRQDFFDFTPSHTLFLAGNHQPQVSAGGKSFWRRLRLIPFRHEVPAEQRNENLARELVDHEGPAILAWITAGTVDMLTGGLDEPSSVAAATGEYEEQEDALKRFLDECCHLGGGITVKTKTSVVLARYQRWARENGETEMGAKVLSRELANRFGIRSVASNGVRFYNSVALVSEESEQRWND